MSYYNSKISTYLFAETIEKIIAELKKEGFGILTQIDVKETLKAKLDVEFRNYKILGACNPPFAYKALQVEENIGVMLPCNVVVQELKNGEVQVSIINPLESMKSVNNNELKEVAIEISRSLENVLMAL